MSDFLGCRRVRLGLVLCLAALALARTAAASPVDLYGYGPRAISMGGAFTGLADDYSAVYYNPAGMVFIPGNTFAVGAASAEPFFQLHLHPARDITAAQAHGLYDLEHRETDIKRQDSVFLGFTSRLTSYLAVGLMAEVPTDTVITLHPMDVHIPSFIMYENRGKQAVTYLGAAVSPVTGFGFGGGISLFANVKGTLTLPITASNQSVPTASGAASSPLRVPSDLTLNFPYSYSPYAGVMFRPCEWLRFGATYRGAFQWDVDVKLNADLQLQNYTINLADLPKLMPGILPLKAVVSIYAPALGNKPLRVPVQLDSLDGTVTINAYAPVSMEVEMADHWKPQELALGASANIGDAWTISSDVTWQGWSQFPSPEMKFTVSNIAVNLSTLPTSIRARLHTLSVPVLGIVGPLPPVQVSIPGLQTTLNLKFPTESVIRPVTHDIYIPRIGVEYKLPPVRSETWLYDTRFALRAGYSYQPTPFTPQGGYINLVDSNKHIFTAGAGVTFNRSLSLDLFGECHYLMPMHFAKATVDTDEPFDAVTANGYVLSTGASVTYRW